MLAKTFRGFRSAGAIVPYLWGFAGALAFDYIIDVKVLFLPAVTAAALVSCSLIVRKAGR